MICGNCGAQVPDNTNFCTHCGARLVPLLNQGGSESTQGDPSAQSQQGQYPQSGSYQAQPAFNRGSAPSDPALTECINSLNTMNVLQIITLVLFFLPVVSLAAFVMMLVILVMSLSLTDRVRNVFDRTGNQAYADLVARIRGMCKFILGYYVAAFIVVFALIIMFVAASDPAELMGDSAKSLFAVAGLGLAAVYILASIYAIYAEVYCFIRLYHVRSTLLQLSAGNSLPSQVPSSGCLTAAIVGIALFALVAVGGIVAATLLPEYSKHEARARFTEVVAAASAVKMHVELCLFDVGPEGAATYCSTGKKANAGLGQRGWDLSMPPEAYATTYVSRITVDGGVITVTGHVVGSIPETIILVPEMRGGSVNWTVSPSSSCLRNDLC